jgi:predicted histidine transporter YuiF (NhaC family)
MQSTRTGLILTLAGSLVLGVVFGLIYHWLFLKNVPQQWLSSAQTAITPAIFVGMGLLLGVVICLWALLVAWLAPRFRRSTPKAN